MVVMLEPGPVRAPDDERVTLQKLAEILARSDAAPILLDGDQGESVRLPASVREALARSVHALARGKAVEVVAIDMELTTQQAADLLNVSRPFLIKLLDAGEIPFYLVGRNRRIRFDDVMAYRRRRSRDRQAALIEMARDAQETGLYE
jgi:excisionase family DNA binding protein